VARGRPQASLEQTTLPRGLIVAPPHMGPVQRQPAGGALPCLGRRREGGGDDRASDDGSTCAAGAVVAASAGTGGASTADASGSVASAIGAAAWRARGGGGAVAGGCSSSSIGKGSASGLGGGLGAGGGLETVSRPEAVRGRPQSSLRHLDAQSGLTMRPTHAADVQRQPQTSEALKRRRRLGAGAAASGAEGAAAEGGGAAGAGAAGAGATGAGAVGAGATGAGAAGAGAARLEFFGAVGLVGSIAATFLTATGASEREEDGLVGVSSPAVERGRQQFSLEQVEALSGLIVVPPHAVQRQPDAADVEARTRGMMWMWTWTTASRRGWTGRLV
jgi:hypothetical protein